MRVDLFILGDHRDSGVSFQERVAQFVAQAQLAEELGFGGVWLAEHHFTPYGIVGNTLTMAAAIAASTSDIRIGTGIVILPFMHPLRLAEEAALVDTISGGRLDLGVGRGYQPGEFRVLEMAMDESQERFDEGVTVLERALTGKPFSHAGKYWHFEDVVVSPTPVQQPLPIWVAAGSPGTFERLGRERRAILTSPNFTPAELVQSLNRAYLDAWASAGPPTDPPEIPMLKQVYVGTSESQAREIPRDYCLAYFRLLGHLIAEEGESHPSYEMYEKGRRRLETVTYDRLLKDGVVFGTSDEVVAQLENHQRELGVTRFLAWMDFGGLPITEVMASIERLGRDVIPRLNDGGVSGA